MRQKNFIIVVVSFPGCDPYVELCDSDQMAKDIIRSTDAQAMLTVHEIRAQVYESKDKPDVLDFSTGGRFAAENANHS